MSARILHLSGRCNYAGMKIQYPLNSRLHVAHSLSGPFGGKKSFLTKIPCSIYSYIFTYGNEFSEFIKKIVYQSNVHPFKTDLRICSQIFIAKRDFLVLVLDSEHSSCFKSEKFVSLNVCLSIIRYSILRNRNKYRNTINVGTFCRLQKIIRYYLNSVGNWSDIPPSMSHCVTL
jgi:hypothetical protein